MRDPRLSKRYARALFKMTEEHAVSDRVATEFEHFISILDQHRRLGAFLGTPNVSSEDKEGVLRTVLNGLVDESLEEFLVLLRRKGRFMLVREVAEEFHKLFDASRGVVKARVTTAVALAESERQRVVAALERKTGHRIELEERVDPAVIGGMAVVMGSQIIDDTIRHHLGVLRDQLANVSVHMTAEGVSG